MPGNLPQIPIQQAPIKCSSKTLAIRHFRNVDFAIQQTVASMNRWRATEGATEALLRRFEWPAGG